MVDVGGGGSGGYRVSGVAPGAYLMAYKFDNAYTPEILRMIDDAVADLETRFAADLDAIGQRLDNSMTSALSSSL